MKTVILKTLAIITLLSSASCASAQNATLALAKKLEQRSDVTTTNIVKRNPDTKKITSICMILNSSSGACLDEIKSALDKDSSESYKDLETSSNDNEKSYSRIMSFSNGKIIFSQSTNQNGTKSWTLTIREKKETKKSSKKKFSYNYDYDYEYEYEYSY